MLELLGSTAMVKSYHACPREKSVEGIPESASTGLVMLVHVEPLLIVFFNSLTALLFSTIAYT